MITSPMHNMRWSGKKHPFINGAWIIRAEWRVSGQWLDYNHIIYGARPGADFWYVLEHMSYVMAEGIYFPPRVVDTRMFA